MCILYSKDSKFVAKKVKVFSTDLAERNNYVHLNKLNPNKQLLSQNIP